MKEANSSELESNRKQVTDCWTRSRKLVRWLPVAVVFALSVPAFAQTKLKLSAIKPGTERVQLINNGDFQFQGPLTGTNYPFPTGWSSGVDMSANAGTNMVPANSGVVARAQVNSSAPATPCARAEESQAHFLADELLELVWGNFAQALEPRDLRLAAQLHRRGIPLGFAVAIDCLLLVAGGRAQAPRKSGVSST